MITEDFDGALMPVSKRVLRRLHKRYMRLTGGGVMGGVMEE